MCFSSVDSDEDDEEEESHSSREVCCLPFLSFGQFVIICCLCIFMECKTASGSQMQRASLSLTQLYVHGGFADQIELGVPLLLALSKCTGNFADSSQLPSARTALWSSQIKYISAFQYCKTL